jgi:DNA processing protein
MPGSIHSPLSKGCHKLIKDGAALVEGTDDVLAALGLPGGQEALQQRPANKLSPDPLLHAIGFAPLSPDQIALRTGLAAAAVAARLSRLQLEGRIVEVAGGRFQRVERT